MPRFIVVDNGVVVGVLGAPTVPTVDVPAGRLYVNGADLPDIKGGESYDAETGIFSQPLTSLEQRIEKVEEDVQALQGQAIVPLPVVK